MKKLKLADFSKIKAIVSDIDGIWTDGRIWMDAQGNAFRSFHIHDGYGVKQVIESGYKFAIISGSSADDIHHRAKHLGIEHVFTGVQNKLPVFRELLQTWKLSSEEVLYIGDDQPDVQILDEVGIAVTVPNSHLSFKEKDYYSTELSGGHGALRELCDLLVEAKADKS